MQLKIREIIYADGFAVMNLTDSYNSIFTTSIPINEQEIKTNPSYKEWVDKALFLKATDWILSTLVYEYEQNKK